MYHIPNYCTLFNKRGYLGVHDDERIFKKEISILS